MLFYTKIILTIVTLGYSVVPMFFDFNNTHATNPSWTGHARYHLVWQIVSYNFIALMALYLIWSAGADADKLIIPSLLSVFAYGGFWTAYLTRKIYGGLLKDEVNGIPDLTCTLFNYKFQISPNVMAFAFFSLLTLIGILMVFFSSSSGSMAQI